MMTLDPISLVSQLTTWLFLGHGLPPAVILQLTRFSHLSHFRASDSSPEFPLKVSLISLIVFESDGHLSTNQSGQGKYNVLIGLSLDHSAS